MTDNQTITGLSEKWHRMKMDVSWTDSGKILIRHDLADGGRITHAIEISPEQAQRITHWSKNA